MARRSRPRATAAGLRRKRVWARHLNTTTTLTSGTVTLTDLLAQFETAYDADPIGVTIARIRGELTVEPVSTTATHVTMGILVGPDTLDNVDVDPFTTSHLDFMWYDAFRMNVKTAGAVDDTRRLIDVKAMRKLDELNMTLWMALLAQGQNTNVSINLSSLLLLP